MDHGADARGPQTLNNLMKRTLISSWALLAGAAVCFTASLAEARNFGVSSQSYGRGTKYTTERGGTAYVGPRGVAGESAGGRYGAATARGAAVGGPNAAAVSGRYGAAAVGQNGAAVARYGAGYAVRPVAAAAALPGGYLRAVPAGYTAAVYGGYNCLYVGGVYYRPVIYGGETVYVVVN